MTANEMEKLYDMVFSIPSMNDVVKVDLRMTRKLLLLLNQILEAGLRQSENEKGALNYYPTGSAEELRQVLGEGLEKAGLTETYGKLESFQAK